MRFDHDGWNGGGEWFAMVVMMVLLWGLLVALVAWVVRSARAPHVPPTTGRAHDLLAERFAKGEIDEDEYAHRHEVLQRHASGTSGKP